MEVYRFCFFPNITRLFYAPSCIRVAIIWRRRLANYEWYKIVKNFFHLKRKNELQVSRWTAQWWLVGGVLIVTTCSRFCSLKFYICQLIKLSNRGIYVGGLLVLYSEKQDWNFILHSYDNGENENTPKEWSNISWPSFSKPHPSGLCQNEMRLIWLPGTALLFHMLGT